MDQVGVDFEEHSKFDFLSSNLEWGPAKSIHIFLGVTMLPCVVTSNETGCSFVDKFEFLNLVVIVRVPS